MARIHRRAQPMYHMSERGTVTGPTFCEEQRAESEDRAKADAAEHRTKSRHPDAAPATLMSAGRSRSSSTRSRRRSSGRSSKCSRAGASAWSPSRGPLKRTVCRLAWDSRCGSGSDQGHAQKRDVCGHAILQQTNRCHGSLPRRQARDPRQVGLPGSRGVDRGQCFSSENS